MKNKYILKITISTLLIVIVFVVLIHYLSISGKEGCLDCDLTPITIFWEEAGILSQKERRNFIKGLNWFENSKDWNNHSYSLITSREEVSNKGNLLIQRGTWLDEDGKEVYKNNLFLYYPVLASCGDKLCVFGLESKHFASIEWWYKIPVFGDLRWGLNSALNPIGDESEFIILTFPDKEGYLVENNPCSERAIDSFRILQEEENIRVELLCSDKKLYRTLFNTSEFFSIVKRSSFL